jgi:hypothetical protein
MIQATDVFTPTDVPTLTYVECASRDFEADLRNAFNVPKMIVSISGPSKSGKTVLVTKVVAPDNLIHIYGANIKTPEDLWSNVLTWIGGPVERTETTGSKIAGELSATAGGKGGIPVIAEAKADVTGGLSVDSSTSTAKKYSTTGLDAIVREIGDSDYVVFVDDFHYIERNVQEEIGKQIKAAAEKGIRICTASVPHRSDDVVRSNPELRGRVTAIDMSYWTDNELEQIAFRGFRELNVDLAPAVIRALANTGHTDEQKIIPRNSNLDALLLDILHHTGNVSSLTPADNAGLGLARATAVVRVLMLDVRLKDYTLLPLSGGQLIGVDDRLTKGGGGDERERRRIEIRVRRANSTEVSTSALRPPAISPAATSPPPTSAAPIPPQAPAASLPLRRTPPRDRMVDPPSFPFGIPPTQAAPAR